MAIIESSKDQFNDLTVHIVQGELTADEIIQTVKESYSENPTKFVIWNLLSGTLSKISSDDLDKAVKNVKLILNEKKLASRKTAIIISEDMGVRPTQ